MIFFREVLNMDEKLEAQTFSRKRYIIAPDFQFKYVGIMLSTVLSTGLFIGGCVYLILMAVINKNLPFLDRRQLFADMIFSQANQFFLIALPLVLVIVVVMSIFVSHKISGPEYRIKRILDSMGRGDFAVPVKLRKGDELQLLADTLVEVNHNLSYMIKEQKLMVKELDASINAIARELKKNQPNCLKLLPLAGVLSSTSKKLKADFENLKILDV